MTADARLAIPVAAAWAVLALILGVPVALPWVAAACWALAVLLLLVASRSPSRVWLVLTLGATLAGLMLTSAAAAAPGRWPDALVAAADSGAVLRGTVTTTETVHDGDTRFDARLTSGSIAGNDFEASVPVLVFGSTSKPVAIGTELGVVATIAPAEPYRVIRQAPCHGSGRVQRCRPGGVRRHQQGHRLRQGHQPIH